MRVTQQFVDAYNARRGHKAEPAKLPPSQLREAEIQEQIAAYLRSFGRDCAFDVSRMDKPTTCQVGRPDFVGVLRGVGFAIEVKRPGCKETLEQAGQLMRWQLAGARVAVVHSLAEAVEFITGRVIQ